MMFYTINTLIVTYCILSLVYVYKFRGQERFLSISEYMRKGWPIFAPLNVFLYLNTEKRGRKSIVDMDDYPELKVLEDNWEIIAEEATALMQSDQLDSIVNKDSTSYYDVGFKTFYKYGWRKFYLKWYGNYEHQSALNQCPKTVALLRQCPSVNGAMFSLLPPGSQLTRHLDPFASSLRYHLGLSTPNHDDAFISIDGNKRSWRDGKAFMFDETFLHFAKNNTDTPRLIMMCDVERPSSIVGRVFNAIVYKPFLKVTVVPNTNEDKKGLFNRIFSGVSPILARSKALKQTNKPLYNLLKYGVNITLLAVLFSLIFGLIKLIVSLVS